MSRVLMHTRALQILVLPESNRARSLPSQQRLGAKYPKFTHEPVPPKLMFARTDALFKRIADSPVGAFHKRGLQVRPRTTPEPESTRSMPRTHSKD